MVANLTPERDSFEKITIIISVLSMCSVCEGSGCKGSPNTGCCHGFFRNSTTQKCERCIPGYIGVNCSSPCPYPYYGVDCQKTCNCSRDRCDVSTGCISLTTGKDTTVLQTIYRVENTTSLAIENNTTVSTEKNHTYNKTQQPSTGSPLDTPHFTEVEYIPLDATILPDLPFSAIVRFMIDRQIQGRAVQNFRGLDRASKHFEAGDVKDIQMAKVNDSTTYFKAFCLASMKKIRYQIFISAICQDGELTVSHAYCQCPIGLAQSCSHIGSLLFALNSIKKEAGNSCTSKLCKWNVPRQLNLPAAPLAEMNLRKAGSIASDGDQPIKKALQFDPRHPDQRVTDLSALRALRDVFPNTGMTCIWDIPETTPDPLCEITIITTVNPLESAMQKLVKFSESLDVSILQPISETLASVVEMSTRLQRNSPEWVSLHKGRLTSSMFGDIIRAGENPRSLISGILHGSSLQWYSTLPPAVQWGIDNEERARQDYIKLMRKVSDVSVQPLGLTILPSCPYIGASGDGKIHDKSMPEGCQEGVLEIKCPYSINGEVITSKEVHEIDLDFMGMHQGRATLNHKHKYYAQVQGEMAVLGLTWCDFVIWTAAAESNVYIQKN